MAERTALVLSAGGMFGAYQAGAWKALAPHFQPDLVVGASIGALNGWLIAGGCPPEEMERYWLTLGVLSESRWKMPRSPFEGVLDGAPIQGVVRELYNRFPPRLDYGVVITDLVRLRPRLVRTPDVTWQHLAASCAVLGVLDQPRIGGRVYSDGGLLGSLPLWAALEMGAARIVAIQALPRMPSALLRIAVGGLRKLARFRPRLPETVEVIRLAPREPLGSARDAIRWRREHIERWLAQGAAEGEQIKHSIQKCFG